MTPVIKFDKEFIKNLILHSTVSSLRRAGAVAKQIVRIESQSHPIISAIFDGTSWTFHCLISDANKYLLEKAAGGSAEVPGPDSAEPSGPTASEPAVSPSTLEGVSEGTGTTVSPGAGGSL